MVNLILLFFYIATPVWILLLCKRFKPIQKVGEVLMAYFAGIFFAIIIWVFQDSGVLAGEQLTSLRSMQSTICEMVIPFAIPLMLFSANLTHLRKQLSSGGRALLTGLVAVTITTTTCAFVFHPYIGDNMYKVAGLITGVEVGGTPNMAALQFALRLPENTFIQLQAADMLVCFFYLLFIFTIGKVILRKLLPKYVPLASGKDQQRSVSEGQYYFMRSRGGLIQMLKSLGVSVLLVAISVGSSMLLFGEIRVPYLMLVLTTLSIAASFIKPVRNLRYSFDVGMFLVLVFNISIASMVDFSDLLNPEMYYLAGYVASSVFGSVLLHALLCKLFKVDADTFIVSSNALINSPPFVPVVAAAIGNRQVILVGITVGIVGYAVGNYLGFTVAEILKNVL